jgi:DNA-binding CsgD family transcriptional regulator
MENLQTIICRQKYNTKLGDLSPRETEVRHLIVKGMTNKVIVNKLNISVNTVNTHRANLMKKFDIHTFTALVALAFENGEF